MRRSHAAAFLAGCGSLLIGSSFSRAPEIPAPGELRVASYNVNYGLAGDPETLDALLATRADVVFVQEANAAWADAFRGLQEAYPHQALVDHGAAGGLAVLSRFPFDSGAVVDSPVGWFPAWRVVVDTPCRCSRSTCTRPSTTALAGCWARSPPRTSASWSSS